MAASDYMPSAVSSQWQSGTTLQQWCLCSGLKPGRRSSACLMPHPTSMCGTCPEATQSLWSLKVWILTGSFFGFKEKGIDTLRVLHFNSNLPSFQGDSHGFVWRLGSAQHICWSRAGTPLRNNRLAVFPKAFSFSSSYRSGEVGKDDGGGLLWLLKQQKYIFF